MQYFKKRPSPLLSKAIIAAMGLNLISVSSFAADGTPETIPNTYTDLPVPTLSSWNTDNIETLDGVTAATPKSHVYPTAAKDDPDGSVAAVYWELDNNSGRSPGIQVVTDDFDVPTNNCIMASGELESTDFPGTVVPKTCSDGEGSSKRYFLEVTQADKPVDLAFNLGKKDIRYKGVKDPATDGGEALAEFREEYGIARIYRVIQKVINNTNKRVVSIKFEIGTGIADQFIPLNYEDDGVAFEMRSSVPREFFEGETGAPDVEVWDPLRFATFSPKMFDDGSRQRFDPGFLSDAAAGFLPPQIPAAGVEKASVIDSGTSIANGIIGSLTANYFDINAYYNVTVPGNVFGYMLPDSLLPTVIGQYSTNEIGGESDSILAIWDGANWRAGYAGLDITPAVAPYGVIPNSQLEQWAAKPIGLDIPGEDPATLVRYDSLLSDDLSGLNTDVYIYIGEKLLDENLDLKYDSITLRLTLNSVDATLGGAIAGNEEPEWVIPGNEAPTLASYTVATGKPVAINDMVTTVETAPVTISVLSNDLLDGAALVPADGTISLVTSATNGTAIASAVDKTISYQANAGFTGTDSFSYTVTVGALGAEKISNVATVKVVVDAAPVPDAPIANNDSGTTFQDTTLTLNVLANDDLNNDTPTTTVVSINNAALNGTANVNAVDNSIIYTPNAGFIGFERFTYTLTVDGKVSNSALITIRVDEPTPEDDVEDTTVVKKKSSSSGCSVGDGNAPFDPMLPAMLLLALAGLFIRRKKLNL